MYEHEFLIFKLGHIFHIRNPLSFSKKINIAKPFL